MKRARRGFSLIELLIAAGLSVIFASAVSVALVNTMSLTQDSLARGTLEQRVRQVSDTMVFFLRGAGAPGVCLDPNAPGGWPLADCGSVGERSSAFDVAAGTSMTFYSYATQLDGSTDASVLDVPDKVVFAYADGKITIERYAPVSSATYTNPSWVTDPELVRELAATVSGGTPLFRFFDSAGVSLTDTSGAVPQADLPRIALVEVHPRVETQVRGESRTAGLDLAVAVTPGLGGPS